MRKVLIVYFIVIMYLSCAADEKVVVTKTISERKGNTFVTTIVKEEYPLNTEQLVISIPVMGAYILKIDGAEKLTNVKRLAICYDVQDYSFLDKLINVEILVLKYLEKPIDFSFIKNMKKLKILYVNAIVMENDELDFISNHVLKFVSLGNIRSKKHHGPHELKFRHVPKSIEYIDLSLSAFIVLDAKLFDDLKNAKYIIVYKDDLAPEIESNKAFFQTHPNIKIGNWRLLPEQYSEKNIFGLFGIDPIQ